MITERAARRDPNDDKGLAVCWDRCLVYFALGGFDTYPVEAERMEWPVGWSLRGALHPAGTDYVFEFLVNGVPRPADGALVRAKLNMLPKRGVDAAQTAG